MKNIAEALRIGVLLLCLGVLNLSAADQPRPGILNKPAPSWGIAEWMNLPKDTKTLDIGNYKGKVLYIYGFQSWCPGCHRHGFPTLKKIVERFGDDKAVGIVAVQTAYEGFSSNGFEQAKAVAKRYGLKIPIGQSGSKNERSKFMQRYRTGGTPWTIVVDRKGVVRFNDFHIEPSKAMDLIEKLKKEK